MSTPYYAPLHSPYPWEFTGGQVVALKCRADSGALQKMVPTDETSLRHDGSNVCHLWLLDFPLIAGAGSYRELLVIIPCMLDDRRVAFTSAAYVTNDVALAAGRERNGIPKKLAEIDWGLCNEQIVGRVRRSGVEFVTMGMTLDSAVTAGELARHQEGLNGPSLNWMTVPAHRPEGGPAYSGLLESRLSATIKHGIKGRGFVDLRPSAADPLFELNATALSATYYQLDVTLRDPTIPSEVRPHHES